MLIRRVGWRVFRFRILLARQNTFLAMRFCLLTGLSFSGSHALLFRILGRMQELTCHGHANSMTQLQFVSLLHDYKDNIGTLREICVRRTLRRAYKSKYICH